MDDKNYNKINLPLKINQNIESRHIFFFKLSNFQVDHGSKSTIVENSKAIFKLISA